MKPLRLPGLWLGLWAALLVTVAYLSLGAPRSGPDVPASDKWMHLTTYFVVAAAGVQLFRTGRPLQVAAAFVVLFGIAMEVGQGTLTADRTMDWRDAVANAIGVGLGILTCRTPVRDALLRAVPSARD
ncbi:MAG: VanZ family protein [Propionibacteriales bacterium]|nr:VanZ family protein [Propionibacteriales bacterium]